MPAVPFNKQNDITDVAVRGDTAHVDIWYPRIEGKPKYIHVGLMDVRASDGIRISYDFERDGWVIEQNAPTMEPLDGRDDAFDMVDHWKEVYFAQSWAIRPKETEEFFEAK